MKPRSVGTPITAGLLPPAGFDRSFRRHGVRGLIDFPFPCRTVPTQVLRYKERSVVASDLTTVSAGVELPPSCLRMASHRRPSRPSVDRVPEREANMRPARQRVNTEAFPKEASWCNAESVS